MECIKCGHEHDAGSCDCGCSVEACGMCGHEHDSEGSCVECGCGG